MTRKRELERLLEAYRASDYRDARQTFEATVTRTYHASSGDCDVYVRVESLYRPEHRDGFSAMLYEQSIKWPFEMPYPLPGDKFTFTIQREEPA